MLLDIDSSSIGRLIQRQLGVSGLWSWYKYQQGGRSWLVTGCYLRLLWVVTDVCLCLHIGAHFVCRPVVNSIGSIRTFRLYCMLVAQLLLLLLLVHILKGKSEHCWLHF